MTSVSVVIPTYNRAEFILDAIDTVMNQSFQDYEILIIDDGSTDETAIKVKPILSNKKIRYLHQENKGVSAARNLGIKNAQGDYIAFLDSDDLWEKDHLLKLHSALSQYLDRKIAFSFFNFEGNDENANRANQAFENSVTKMLNKSFEKSGLENNIWLSNKALFSTLIEQGFVFRIQGSMIDRELLITNQIFFDEQVKYTEEAAFVTNIALFSDFLFISDKSLIVRLHEENTNEQKYVNYFIQSLEGRKKFLNELIEVVPSRFNGGTNEKLVIRKAIFELSEEILYHQMKTGHSVDVVKNSLRLFWNWPSIRSAKDVAKAMLYKMYQSKN